MNLGGGGTQLQSTAHLEFRIYIWRQENSHRDGKLNDEWSFRPPKHFTKMERTACERYSAARKAEGREHPEPHVGSLPWTFPNSALLSYLWKVLSSHIGMRVIAVGGSGKVV